MQISMHTKNMIYGYARGPRRPPRQRPSALTQGGGVQKDIPREITGTRPTGRSLPLTAPPRRRGITGADWLSRDTTDLRRSPATCSAGAGLRSIAEPLSIPRPFRRACSAMLGVAAKRTPHRRARRGAGLMRSQRRRVRRKPALTPHQQQEARKRLIEGETQQCLAAHCRSATISRL
jgi:hypothetical protein